MTDAYQLNAIRFNYADKQALSIDRLDIQAHKITALLGPNGSGKSTLLNLLAFLQPIQQGEMRFFSETVNYRRACGYRRRIALLTQKPYMLRGTVSENLALVVKFHQIKQDKQKKINAVLEQLGINHLAHQQAQALSGGEQQKVALARAIISDPEVLLMDEPFSYLDHNSAERLECFILRYVREQQKTLIFSTHQRIQGISLSDQVISLIEGKPAASTLINLFHGSADDQCFDTGHLKLNVAGLKQSCAHVVVDPDEIEISLDKPMLALENNFHGRVIAFAEDLQKIRVTVNVGERFQLMLSRQQIAEMNICLGKQLWLNFESTAVRQF